MSTTLQAPTKRRSRRTPSPAEVLTPEPKRQGNASSLPFIGLVAAILSGGLLALLMVNNSLAAGSFEQARLRADQVALFEQEQVLRQQVERLSSPTQVRKAARRLGMLPAATTVYFDAATGRILGVPKPAGKAVGGETPLTGEEPLAPTDLFTEPGAEATEGATEAGEAAPSDEAGAAAESDSETAEPSPAEGDGAAITDSEPLSAYDRAVITGGIEE